MSGSVQGGCGGTSRFTERYDRELSDAARAVEMEVYGEVIGSAGYTTPTQARTLLDWLRLEPGATLLELGTGRGWPGVFLGRESGAALIQMDVPVEALRQADARAEAAGLGGRSIAVAANGKALPLRTRSVDGVAHADVLC